MKGRRLQIPKLSYGKGKLVTPDNGQWNIINTPLHTPGCQNNALFYAYFNVNNSLRQYDIDDIRTGVNQLLRQMRTDVGALISKEKPRAIPFTGHTFEEIAGGIRNYFENAKEKGTINKFWLIVLPDDKTLANSIYKFMKKLGDVDYGFHTISVTRAKLVISQRAASASIRANIALKFNLKAGGINHIVNTVKPNNKLEGIGLIGEGRTMVVGYDVSHPTGDDFDKSSKSNKAANKGVKPKDDENLPPSFVGLVASVNHTLNRWPAVAWQNPSRDEMLDRKTLGNQLIERLKTWKQNNKKELPDNIIVYRDGVSEGQYKAVLKTEVATIRDASAYYYKEDEKGPPNLIFIVTVKRHQTRFYPMNGEADKKGNPKNGLVVDDVINTWSFFLQPHTAMQGKKSPRTYTAALTKLVSQEPYARSTIPYSTIISSGESTELMRLVIWSE